MCLGVFPLTLQGEMNSCWATATPERRVKSLPLAVPLGRGEVAEERPPRVSYRHCLRLFPFIRKLGAAPRIFSGSSQDLISKWTEWQRRRERRVSGSCSLALSIHAQISTSVSCEWGNSVGSSHFCLDLLIYTMGQFSTYLCPKLVENIV